MIFFSCPKHTHVQKASLVCKELCSHTLLSHTAFPQGLCFVTEFSNMRVFFKPLCWSWLLTASKADAYARWNKSACIFLFFLFFFNTWNGFMPHKVPAFSPFVSTFLSWASFAWLSSSAISPPHVFIGALSADSYSTRENPLYSSSSMPPTLSLSASVPQDS